MAGDFAEEYVYLIGGYVLDNIKLCFDVYFKDIKTGRVELDGINIVRKECYLPEGIKYPFIFFPFYNINSGYVVREMLADRVYPPDRQDIEMILEVFGLKEYDMYAMIRKNHGATPDDCTWFKFDDQPEDATLTFEDVRARG